MKRKALVVGLMSVGLVLVFVSFALGVSNAGSCPMMAYPAPHSLLWFGSGACDHTMTLGGVTFWIGQASEGTFVLGLLSVASGAALLMYDSTNGRRGLVGGGDAEAL